MSNPQPSCFGLLLGWVAVAWLGFGVMTIMNTMVVHIVVTSVNSGPVSENLRYPTHKSDLICLARCKVEAPPKED